MPSPPVAEGTSPISSPDPHGAVLNTTYSWQAEGLDEEKTEKTGVAALLKEVSGVQVRRGLDTRSKRFFYKIEQAMAERGRVVQIPMLMTIGFFQVMVLGFLWSMVWRPEADDPRPEARRSRYIEGFWAAWTFMSDGGTHAKVFHAEQRFVGGLITTCGIIYMATVLAFIVDMVREKMDAMRVGKGQVHEGGHTVILHWTDRTIPLILELAIANESEGGGTLVILAKESTETMQTELAMQLPKFLRRGTKIVVRYGNPAVVGDLIKVSADRAKAVIILASGQSADEADSQTLRCILSLKSMGYKMQGHMVAEVRDVDNEQLLQLVGGKIIETFVSHDVLGRLMLMSVRQLGLANIYDAMLGFEGSEFYVKEWPELVGVPFGELSERFPHAVPIGICARTGALYLNPPLERVLEDGDQVVVIAEDDDSYSPCPPEEIEVGDPPPAQTPEIVAEKLLICGWRRDIRDVLKVLDCVQPKGSQVHMMTHAVPIERRNQQLLEEGLNVADLRNISISHYAGNTSVRRRLESLPLETYSACLIFADQAYEEDAMQADSHSLATLVLIRDVQSSRQEQVTCPITCEVLDSRTHRMITKQKQLSLLSDFVQSNKFVARILAMIAEQRSIKLILDELLGPSGNSLLIVPSCWVVGDDEVCSFWQVAKRVAARNAVLIGCQEHGASKQTFLNPQNKKEEIVDWGKYDLAIVAGNRPVNGCATMGIGSMGEEGVETVEPGGEFERKISPEAGDCGRKIRNSNNGQQMRRSVTTSDAAVLLDRVSGDTEERNAADADRERFKGHMSAETAADEGCLVDGGCSAIMRLAGKFWPLMSDAEQRRFGLALEHLGHVVKSGGLLKERRRLDGASAARGQPGSDRPKVARPDDVVSTPPLVAKTVQPASPDLDHPEASPRTPLQSARGE